MNETDQEFPGGLTVRELALSLLWHRFDSWPGNFHTLQVCLKNKTKQKYTNPICIGFFFFFFFFVLCLFKASHSAYGGSG